MSYGSWLFSKPIYQPGMSKNLPVLAPCNAIVTRRCSRHFQNDSLNSHLPRCLLARQPVQMHIISWQVDPAPIFSLAQAKTLFLIQKFLFNSGNLLLAIYDMEGKKKTNPKIRSAK